MSVRLIVSEHDVGRGWRILHRLRRARGRPANQQLLAVVRYGLFRALRGDDIELSQADLDYLLNTDQVLDLEPVA